MDLYRLSGLHEDLAPLNLSHVLNKCISLIEWPSKLGCLIPYNHLKVTFQIDFCNTYLDGKSYEIIPRKLTIKSYGRLWTNRLRKIEYSDHFKNIINSPLQGKAVNNN